MHENRLFSSKQHASNGARLHSGYTYVIALLSILCLAMQNVILFCLDWWYCELYIFIICNICNFTDIYSNWICKQQHYITVALKSDTPASA